MQISSTDSRLVTTPARREKLAHIVRIRLRISDRHSAPLAARYQLAARRPYCSRQCLRVGSWVPGGRRKWKNKSLDAGAGAVSVICSGTFTNHVPDIIYHINFKFSCIRKVDIHSNIFVELAAVCLDLLIGTTYLVQTFKEEFIHFWAYIYTKYFINLKPYSGLLLVTNLVGNTRVIEIEFTTLIFKYHCGTCCTIVEIQR